MLKTLLIIVSVFIIMIYFCLDYGVISGFPLVAKNISRNTVDLYQRADPASNVIALFKPGAELKYAYSGGSRRWIYLDYHGRAVTLEAKKVILGYNVYNLYFLSKTIFRRAVIVSSGFLILLLCLELFRRRRKTRKSVGGFTIDQSEPIYKESEVQALLMDTVRKTTRRLTAKHERTVSKLKASQEIEKEELYKKFKSVFVQDINVEFSKVREPSIDAMIESHLNLRNKYEKAVKDAKTFGIDLRDAKFENLLKGRLFEICVAEFIVKTLGFRMLEWAPDKGFSHEIFVEANLNPDFIIADKHGDKFAIECKYRGSLTKINIPEDSVAWASVSQAQRYSSFSTERNIPVYIAIGVTGDPAMPSLIFMPPIERLISLSKIVDFRNKQEIAEGADKKPSYACLIDKLGEWTLNLNKSDIPWIKSNSQLVL